MNQEVRLKIAGSTRWDDGLDWHLFGHTVINPRTVVSIKERISNFSKALEYIPLTGKVSKNNYMDFLNAFEDKDKSLGYCVSVVSRILAMKRPDIFICLTQANRENIKNDFGINKEIKSNEYERYWDEIIERIHKSDWFLTSEPKDLIEKDLWEKRVAMLDSIFYTAKL